MKVLFLELVPNVWHKWDIKEVSDSYARNVLIPKWLAKRLTPQDEAKIRLDEKKKEAQRRELIENRHSIVEKLNFKTLEFEAKTKEDKKIFWSIWEHEIINKISKDFQVKLQKKHIDMPNWHIKKIGSSDVYVKLWQDSIAKLTIIVK